MKQVLRPNYLSEAGLSRSWHSLPGVSRTLSPCQNQCDCQVRVSTMKSSHVVTFNQEGHKVGKQAGDLFQVRAYTSGHIQPTRTLLNTPQTPHCQISEASQVKIPRQSNRVWPSQPTLTLLFEPRAPIDKKKFPPSTLAPPSAKTQQTTATTTTVAISS